jgi:protein-L-isoaspartate O-methyltransferase
VLDGMLVVEVHEELAEQARELLDELGYVDTEVRPDLTGRPRMVEGRWRPL